MVARATAPNRVGPESVFPDAAKWDFEEGLKGKGESYLSTTFHNSSILGSPMALPAFWVALICQLIIVWGYFWFYRKEQLGLSFSFELWY
jgi:alpha-1,3-glucan synthase